MAYRDVVLADSPSAYWRLGDASGPTVTATVGNNLTAANSPTFGSPGLLTNDSDTAVAFVGASSQSATGSDTGLPSGNGNWSVEAWIKTSSSAEMVIAWWGTNGTNTDVALGVLSGAVIFDTGGLFNSFGGSVANNLRHHVAMTWDGTTAKAYADGVKVGSDWVPGAFNVTLAGASGMSVGTRSVRFFTGTIDEVAIYGSTLSAGQVAAHFESGTEEGYSYRPVIITSRYRGPRSLRRQFRRPYIRGVDAPTSSNLSLTASDSLSFADTVTRQGTFGRTMTDALSMANVVARVGTFLRTASDALGFGDAVTRVVTLTRIAADSVTMGNTVTRLGTFNRTAADSLGFADAVTRVGTFLRAAADSLSFADAVAGIRLIARTVADSLNIGDAVSRTGTFLRTAADSLTIGNTVARVGTFLRVAADTLGFADAVDAVKSGTIVRTLTDALNISDGVTRTGTFLRTAADSLNIAQTVAGLRLIVRTVADSLSIGNTVSRVGTFARTAADSVTIGNTASRVLSLTRTLADSLTVATSVAATKAVVIGSGITEAVGRAFNLIARAVGIDDTPAGSAKGATPTGGAGDDTPKGRASEDTPQ